MFKENKWYNLGDANPREHGGVFVKRIGNEIEIVSTDNNENYGGKGYTINERSEYIDELKARFEKFKQTKTDNIGNFADWERYIELEKEDDWDLDRIVFYLASDVMSYYGPSTESETGTNYWELLGCHGIRPNNYS